MTIGSASGELAGEEKEDSEPLADELRRRAERRVRKAPKAVLTPPQPMGVPVHLLVNMWAVRSIEEQPHIETARWRIFVSDP